MADTPNERSGSRWEPDPSDQTTEQLGGPIETPTDMIPGLQSEPAPPVAPAPKRRIPRAAAAIAIVAAATIGGGAVGLAVAGNRAQEVSDTAVTSESTPGDQGAPGGTTGGDQSGPDGSTGTEGTAPDGSTGSQPFDQDGDGYGFHGDDDGDGYGPSGHFGHHGPGGH